MEPYHSVLSKYANPNFRSTSFSTHVKRLSHINFENEFLVKYEGVAPWHLYDSIIPFIFVRVEVR